jgi:hypothetical protein
LQLMEMHTSRSTDSRSLYLVFSVYGYLKKMQTHYS